MRTWLFFISLFSIIAWIISHNLIPQERAVRPWGEGDGQGGGGPWNPPLPRSRGFTRPPTPRPRTPRHLPPNDDNDNDNDNISYDDKDYPVRKPISLRHHRPRSRYPAPRPSFDSEQPPYPIYPKLKRANSIGESKRSKFENTPSPGS